MTAIVAYAADGGVYIGGDSAAVDDGHYLVLTATPKVFHLGPLVIGYTSSFAMGHALQHRLVLPGNIPPADDLSALDRWMAVDFIDAVRDCLRQAGWLQVHNQREHGGRFIVGVRGQIYVIDDDFHAMRQLINFASVGSGITACRAAIDMALRLSSDMGAQFEAGQLLERALSVAENCVISVRRPFHIVFGGHVS